MPQIPSITERSTPKSFSMRAKSGAYSFAFSLPVPMRQSETRRLRYCQICSLNSGWLCSCSKTVVSGFRPRMTRV